MNIGAPWPDLIEAEQRVLAMQTKLHRWAASDPGGVFDDHPNLVYAPAFPCRGMEQGAGEQGLEVSRC